MRRGRFRRSRKRSDELVREVQEVWKVVMIYWHLFFLVVLFLTALNNMSAQNTPCKFDGSTLQFAGSPVEQARCLLRTNGIGGVLGSELKKLPHPLEKLTGQPVVLRKDKLRKYLNKQGITEDALGGSLDLPLAGAQLPGSEHTQALYFVIHDTSSPYLKDEPFPQYFNADKNWKGNDLQIWVKQPVAHIFVNRLGESLTTTPFSEPVRKGWGTKFARDVLKAEAKGFQLHIELVQPRRRDPNGKNPANDLIAPLPGFTKQQYERLALLYVCASVRRGSWLIPAYHSAIDAGIKDAHDDPQNFELHGFAKALSSLIGKID
jgi:hypothetical protein